VIDAESTSVHGLRHGGSLDFVCRFICLPLRLNPFGCGAGNVGFTSVGVSPRCPSNQSRQDEPVTPVAVFRASARHGPLRLILLSPVRFDLPFLREARTNLHQKENKQMKTNKTTKPTETKAAPLYTNRVTLVGFLGKKPDHREGRTVFSLATKISWLPKGTTEWQSQTDWHRIVAWNGLADAVSRLQTGDYVMVEGELRSHAYEREVTGEDELKLKTTVTAWEIHARNVRKLDRPAKKKTAKA
jgi:hypothetical protein